MAREINYNKIDVDILDEIEDDLILPKEKKILHKKKFDDGTALAKNAKKRKQFFNKNKRD